MTAGAFEIREHREGLKDKVDTFLHQLDSVEPSDVAINASVLAEIIQSFSTTFNVPNEIILQIIQQSQGNLNIEDLRRKILSHGK